MCFELVELYLEDSLFLLKACLCNDGENAQNQQGRRWFSHCSSTHIKYLHFVSFVCVFYIFTCIKVCKCPDGGGHGERALLLPRVYLQTVTLMQCNDYFYSRYFGSPFTLSGMTPHWPTDYLCGCCHTWLLQLSSRSTAAPSKPSPLLLLHLHLFVPLSVCLYNCLNPTVGYAFILFGLFLCYNTFIISSSLPSLNHYTFTPPPFPV